MDWKIHLSTIVRQVLTGVGAVLVAKGVVPPEAIGGLLDSTTGVIVGALVALGAYIWSIVSKKNAIESLPPL